MKNKILIAFIFFTSLCFGQQKITWEDLSKVTFTDKYYAEYDDYFLFPKFSKSVQDLEGKTVTITGYFLHIAPAEKIYMLSKGPMSSCFFCGVGGPETAIELELKTKPEFKTDNIVSVTGKFKLNDSDVDHFNYILTNCEVKLVK